MKFILAQKILVAVAIVAMISKAPVCLANNVDLSSPEAAYRTSMRSVQQGLAENYWETMTESGRLRYGKNKSEQIAKIKAEFAYANNNLKVFNPKNLDVDITDTIYSNDKKAALVVAETVYEGRPSSSEASVIMILEGRSWKVLFANASGSMKSREHFKNKSSDEILQDFTRLNETMKKISAQLKAESAANNSSDLMKSDTDKNKTNVVRTGSVVTVGVSNPSSFAKSFKEAGNFFEPYRQAREKIEIGDYQAAIRLFDESLKYSSSKIDLAMVHRVLIGVYGDLGDLENELKSIELFTKYTMNEDQVKRFQKKAEDIREVLAHKRAPITMAERYPMKTVYGGPRFKSYREILIAQEQSRSLREQGDQAAKDRRFDDAIGYYCASYVPDGWDNESIKTGLVKAYAQVGRYADALEVLDDSQSTLKVLGSEEVLNGKVRAKLQQAIKEGKLELVGDADKFPEEIYLGAKLKPPVPRDFRGDPIKGE